MDCFRQFKARILNTRNRLQENSFDNLLWLVNIVPSLAGFSIRGEKIKAPFWIVHLFLLFYVYGVGSVVYQATEAQNASDFIKSYVNVSIFILTANNSYWFLTYRPQLLSLIKMAEVNDKFSRQSQLYRKKHERLIKNIKRIVLIFYGFNLTDAALVYLPYRVNITNVYCMTPCVGMDPVTVTPRREICLTLLFLQEFSIMTVVLNYQALLLVFIAHTATMYQILSDEVIDLNNVDEDTSVNERLSVIIQRHVLTLDSVTKLKNIYSMPIGVNFGSNAVCICLFFFLPLSEYLIFMPILVYCFLVFFLYCFLCQKVINGSEEFERAVYNCGWENFEARDRKSIYIMLLQAQKPITMLAADIIPVNIATFASTCQAIYKFVTVVKL